MSDATPSFYDALKTIFNSFLGEEVNTALPGIIESYDFSLQKATVTPSISKKYLDGDVLQYNPIENVPVVFPGSKGSGLHFPINQGDTVLLIFSQRALENWLSKGTIVIPGDRRRFDITDAMAIPGLMSFNNTSLAQDNTSLQLKNENATIVIKNDDTIELSNNNGKIVIESNGQININNGNLTVEP